MLDVGCSLRHTDVCTQSAARTYRSSTAENRVTHCVAFRFNAAKPSGDKISKPAPASLNPNQNLQTRFAVAIQPGL